MILDEVAAAFPRVPATRGRAWTLAGQARLAESGVLPPPVPREEWRRAPLGADEGTVRRYPGIEAGAAHHVRPHLVAGHLRQIPLGWTPSAAARASARDAGLSLPERGYTYVRPHTRGDGTIEPHRVRVRRDREGRSADE